MPQANFQVELFYTIIDWQLQELNNRFSEANSELLLCVGCLNPSDSFSAFSKDKLIRLAQLYAQDFSAVEILSLENMLEIYIIDVRTSNEFSRVKDIADLAKQMVEIRKNIVY